MATKNLRCLIDSGLENQKGDDSFDCERMVSFSFGLSYSTSLINLIIPLRLTANRVMAPCIRGSMFQLPIFRFDLIACLDAFFFQCDVNVLLKQQI